MSEGDARFAVEVFPRRYVTPFGAPGVPTRCHVLHELSRPIDLGELAFEGEGCPLTSREDRKTAANAPARRVSSGSAPRRPLLLLPRSEGHLWDFDFYDASTGL